MKKLFFLAAAAIAVFACTKSQVEEPGQEIAFQVARYKGVTKANEDYKDNYQGVPFGAYAWYKGVNASDNTTFMVDQKVSYNAGSNVWAPEGTTYYWPKTGSIDFICYSPYGNPLPVISEDSISYANWDVNANPDVDIMYADKVTGLSSNTTTYYYNGVPTLFHHALAKVSFQIKASYLEKIADTGDKTRWEITVSSIVLKDILSGGSLNLTLNPDGTWARPDVWTSNGSKTDITLDVSSLGILDGSTQNLDSDVYVLPQSLGEGQQVELTVTIKTYRDLNDGNGEQLVLTETNVPITALLSGGSLDKWGINQNITYSFNLAPSLGTGTGTDLDGDGIEDQEPTIVYFDPAVDEWENITVNAGINL